MWYVFRLRLVIAFVSALALNACNLSDDSLRGSFSPSESAELAVQFSSVSFKSIPNEATTSDNSPEMTMSLPAELNGAEVSIYSDSACSTLVGQATLAAGSVTVTNINLGTDLTDSERVGFYSKVSFQSSQSSCVDLGLSIDYYPESQFPYFKETLFDWPNGGNTMYTSTGKSVMVFDRASVTRTVIATTTDSFIDLTFNSTTGLVYALENGANDYLVSINPSTGDRTNITGLTTTAGAVMTNPVHFDLNASGTLAYVTDTNIDALVRVNLATEAQVIVSDGSTGTGTAFSNPDDVIINASETLAYVLDTTADTIYQVDLTNGNRTVVSDSGTGTGPNITTPENMDINLAEDTLYLADRSYETAMSIDIASGNRTLLPIASTTGPEFEQLAFVQANPAGTTLAMIDWNTDAGSIHRSRLLDVDVVTGDRTLVFSNGRGTGHRFDSPQAVALLPDGSAALVISDGIMRGVSKVNLTTGEREIFSAQAFGSQSATGSGANFSDPKDIVVHPDGSKAYVADDGFNSIIEIDMATGNRSTLASVTSIENLTINSAGTTIYAIDTTGDQIIQVDTGSGAVSTVSSSGVGTGTAPIFRVTSGFTYIVPNDIVISQDGAYLYVMSNFTDLIEVEIATGNRRQIWQNPSPGSGFAIINSGFSSFRLIDSGQRLLAIRNEEVYSVELASGTVTLLTTLSIDLDGTVPTVSGIDINTAGDKVYLSDSIRQAVYQLNLQTIEFSYFSH